MAKDIYYLVHITDNYTEDWKELKTSEVEAYEYQFPGVYLTLITKENIHNVDLYPGKQILILSKNLLKQKNWHINLRDYNGYISEHNTYFSWNLTDAISKINSNENKDNIGHEVVFHDHIPMKYLCLVINNLSKVSNNMILPNIPIENKVEPDMTKEPFYCYPLEKNYTGIDPFPESSRDFFVKMEIMSKIDINLYTDEIIKKIKEKSEIDINLSTDEIIKKIKEKIVDLYSNRDQQHIEIFKNN